MRDSNQWFKVLDDEDIAFIKRFVLSSGSLKDLAQIYGVSYPTLRLRLDRLIDKIKIADKFVNSDDYELVLRSLFGDGKIDDQTFRKLLSAYQAMKESAS